MPRTVSPTHYDEQPPPPPTFSPTPSTASMQPSRTVGHSQAFLSLDPVSENLSMLRMKPNQVPTIMSPLGLSSDDPLPQARRTSTAMWPMTCLLDQNIQKPKQGHPMSPMTTPAPAQTPAKSPRRSPLLQSHRPRLLGLGSPMAISPVPEWSFPKLSVHPPLATRDQRLDSVPMGDVISAFQG